MKRILAKLWEDDTHTFSNKEKVGFWGFLLISISLFVLYYIRDWQMYLNLNLRTYENASDQEAIAGIALCILGLEAIYMVKKLSRKLEGIQKGGELK